MKLYSYEEQLKNIFSKNTQHDYKSIAREILRKMSLTEIIDSMSYFQNFDKFTYSKLCEQFDLLGYLPSEKSKKSYGFETMIDQQFDKEYNSVRKISDTGVLMSFLIGKYVECRNNEHVFLEVAYQNLIHEIIILVKQQLPLLRSEINSQSFIPIQKALYVFFLFEKEDAFQKFKKIIRYDLKQRKTSNYHLEHFVNAELFFERLNLNYIPKIDSTTNNYDVLIGDHTLSITKNQIVDYLDSADFFNTKVPLVKLQHQYYINLQKDMIKHIQIKEILISFIKEEVKLEVIRSIGGKNICLVDIFISNISTPYSQYDDKILISTKNLLKRKFDDAIMERFILLFYLFKEKGYLYNSTRKIPKILAEYFKLVGFSEGTIINRYNKMNEQGKKLWDLKEQIDKKYFTK